MCDGVQQVVFANARAQADRTGDALILSEFGATKNPREIAYVVRLADRHQLPWLEWTYCRCKDPTDGGTVEGLVYDLTRPRAGANVNAPALDVLDEPYPQLVAGTPKDYGYDPATRTFTLRYTPSGRGETRVHTSPLHYPRGYRATATGATVTSAPNAPTLTLRATPGTPTTTLTLTPANPPPHQRPPASTQSAPPPNEPHPTRRAPRGAPTRPPPTSTNPETHPRAPTTRPKDPAKPHRKPHQASTRSRPRQRDPSRSNETPAAHYQGPRRTPPEGELRITEDSPRAAGRRVAHDGRPTARHRKARHASMRACPRQRDPSRGNETPAAHPRRPAARQREARRALPTTRRAAAGGAPRRNEIPPA
ncbi:hypothetical protein ACFQHO_14955 [Actinomadura yumaensis]|uniref:hypothetical protein n=1 Tax=Actinomadura yumaensis TaxID=111807 RepID=UPI00360F74E4